jgi:hypothetical protein
MRGFSMLRSLLLAAAATLALALPSAAATVFTTDFSADTPGLNVVPNGFSVTGQVDIVGPVNPYGITTPGGNVVDLDGTSGPGEIVSASTYAFGAGETVTLSFRVGGAQRGSRSDSLFARLIFGVVTEVTNITTFGALRGSSFAGLLAPTYKTSTAIAGDARFVLSGLTFTPVNAGSLAFSIGTSSNDNIGPLLASVTLDIGPIPPPAPIPLPAAGPVLVLGLGLLAALRRKRA